MFASKVLCALILIFSVFSSSLVWAEDEDVPTPEEIENMADPGGLPATDSSGETLMPVVQKKKSMKKISHRKQKKTHKKKPASKSKKKVAKKKLSEESQPETEPQEEAPSEMDSAKTDSIKKKMRVSTGQLAIRGLSLGKIVIKQEVRRYLKPDFESQLIEKLKETLEKKTYFEPLSSESKMSVRSNRGFITKAAQASGADGFLVMTFGLEEVSCHLLTATGAELVDFNIHYLLGELKDKNIYEILSDRIIEALVVATPYRGFVTSLGAKGKTAKVNLGSAQQVKEGDTLELFEFRWSSWNAPKRLIGNVIVQKVDGPMESTVQVPAGESFQIEPYAKISHRISPVMATEATSASIVSGRWWFGMGGQFESYAEETASVKYASKVFKVNNSPFGYLAFGNDAWDIRGAFGSASSTSETTTFFDGEILYSVYQHGGAQTAWEVAGGLRVFMVNVTALPGQLTALDSTMAASPAFALTYNYVPKGRVRLGVQAEVFWPVYTSGSDPGGVIFAFGGAGAVRAQIAVSRQLGLEVSGKIRYTRRVLDGQNSIQARESMMGAGLVFSF